MTISDNEMQEHEAASRKCRQCEKADDSEAEFDCEDCSQFSDCHDCQRMLDQLSLTYEKSNTGICNKATVKIENLPAELLHHILVNAVVEELKDLKLAEVSWKDEVRDIIERLKKVSYSWNRTLATSYLHSDVMCKLQGMQSRAATSFSAHLMTKIKFELEEIDYGNFALIGDRLVILHSNEIRNGICRLSVIRLVGNSHLEIEQDRRYNISWVPIGIANYSIIPSLDYLLVGGSNELIYKINLKHYRLVCWREYDGLKRLASSSCGKIMAMTEKKSGWYLTIHSRNFTLVRRIHIAGFPCKNFPFFCNLNPQGNIVYAGYLTSGKHTYDSELSVTLHEAGKKRHRKCGKHRIAFFIWKAIGFNSNSHLLIPHSFIHTLEIRDMRLNLLGSVDLKSRYCSAVCSKDNLVIMINNEEGLISLFRLNYH